MEGIDYVEMRTCETCRNTLPKGKKKYCSEACKPHSYCIDCGDEITLSYTRCRSCASSSPDYIRRHSERMTKFYHDRPEERIIQSMRMKSVLRDPKIREKMSMAAGSRKQSEETKRKISNARKREWQAGKYDHLRKEEIVRVCIACGEPLLKWKKKYCGPECYPASVCVDCGKKISSGCARCLPCARCCFESRMSQSQLTIERHEAGVYDGVYQSPTSIEIMLTKALDSLGILHQTQFRPSGYSRIYDEFISPNILVEVWGSYWHSSKGVQERDLEKARWAHRNNYKFIAIWDLHLKEYGAEFLVKNWILPLNPVKNRNVLRTQRLF